MTFSSLTFFHHSNETDGALQGNEKGNAVGEGERIVSSLHSPAVPFTFRVFMAQSTDKRGTWTSLGKGKL